MKEIFKYSAIVVSLVLILMIIGDIRGCINEKRSETVNLLQGQLEAYKKKATEAEKQFMEKEKERLERIKRLEEENRKLQIKMAQLAEESKEKEAKIKELESIETKLEEMGDLQGLIENLKKQRDEWRERYFIEVKKNELLEKENFNLKLEIKTKDEKIADLFRKQKALEQINKELEELVNAKDKQINWLRTQGKVEKYIVRPLAIIGIISIVRSSMK
ncbi:MAG: hypothetical protein J7L26_12600 [Candidatus Aminicenantes bacterium]|nr:hypothetical protein [Candidatus Aminicenantes bacterium]